MSKDGNVRLAKDRIQQVFRYLQEMHRVKTPPIVDLDVREWCLRLDSLPRSPHVQASCDFTDDNRLVAREPQGGSPFLVKVGRPKEVDCPEPSVVIKNWLKPGWDEVGADPNAILHEKRRATGRKVQSFADSEIRVEAFEEWLERKRQWEHGARDIVDALAAFSELFELHGRFERESEKYQLFLADGVLVLDHPSGPVRHPVLLQRVQLSFHPAIPEFTIVESEDNPEIYTPLLRYVGVDGKGIQHVADLVSERHFHPLGGEPTSEFFKDLVQRFWKKGEFFESDEEAAAARGPHIYRQPQFFLGNRNHGFAENIDRYLDALPHLEELPESLLRIVGIETGRGTDEEEASPDMLLTKHANPEQERVIRRLEQTGAVLVQGPPGTGKSHTIANLIGHLLAQNKSILVTSHASKALRVVREHLAGPLQPLCVSVLQSDEESTKQLEESVTGIVNYIASTSEKKLEREIGKLEGKRRSLKQEHDALRQELLDSAKGEYESIEFLGKTVAPSEVARELVASVGIHDWIPGPIASGADLPLTAEEIGELYSLNEKVPAEDEPLLRSPAPDLARLPSPEDFASLYDELARIESRNLKQGRELWTHEDQHPDALSELFPKMADAVVVLENEEEWVLDCVDAGKTGGDRRKPWDEFVRFVNESAERIPEKEALTFEHGPRVESDKPIPELVQTCKAILKHLESGKRLAKLSTLIRPEWKELIKVSQTDEGPPRKKAHFEAILNRLEADDLRGSLAQRWDRQMASLGAPPWSKLGKKPEEAAARYAAEITRALGWYENVWREAEREIERLGLDWERLGKKVTKAAARSELVVIREVVNEQLEPVIEARRHYLEWKSRCAKKEEWIAYLDGFSRKDPIFAEVKALKAGIKKGNYDTYAESWNRLRDLKRMRDSFERRGELIDRVAAAAAKWAKALRERRGPHGASHAPGDVERAWQFRQWEQILAARSKIDLDKLQEKLHRAKDQLFQVTATYVEKLSWLAQLKRTGLEQQQALNGWLALHKKIGKGTGKNVPRLKEEAKKTLAQCRSAVPVWIMPLSRVVECFDLATTRFDVVILDEASQSDVLGLVAFALGKEAVVVGDHEQVSPYAVGQRSERINALIDEILVDIPNKQLYDGKTSVYDLARQSFGGTIRLLEHFRCVPDIIQFSNQLCYGGEIRPLRSASASGLKHHLVAHHVKDGEEAGGVNKAEALEVASLVSAMCRLEEYEGCTVGVICMVGTDQSLYIDSVLRRRLSVTEYQKRQVLCGNASQFQGDERDVIFLSMVDAPGEGPLTLRQRADARKVFNVAASRARDQLWVVHSLDPQRDLKHGDLRLKLISHAENPEGLRPRVNRERKEFSSELEKQVYLELSRKGHRVMQQYEVGEYVIDLVVEGEAGGRVAIQCDGDRLESVEFVVEALDRQFTLERLGWEFVRLRGSEFFRNPAKVLAKLLGRLEECEIHPFDPGRASPPEEADSPVTKVIKRAEMIRQRWKDIPTVSSIRKRATASDAGPS